MKETQSSPAENKNKNEEDAKRDELSLEDLEIVTGGVGDAGRGAAPDQLYKGMRNY
jgi:hypothetical protein